MLNLADSGGTFHETEKRSEPAAGKLPIAKTGDAIPETDKAQEPTAEKLEAAGAAKETR